MKFYSSFDWAKESIAVRAGQRIMAAGALRRVDSHPTAWLGTFGSHE